MATPILIQFFSLGHIFFPAIGGLDREVGAGSPTECWILREEGKSVNRSPDARKIIGEEEEKKKLNNKKAVENIATGVFIF